MNINVNNLIYILGKFYTWMLLPTHEPSKQEEWPIEKILDRRFNKRTKQEEYLVKYLYYDNSFNQWRPKKDVVEGETSSSSSAT